jgi:TatD DNase family protein
VNLVDSHCHLDHEKFQGDLEETIARARAAGVSRFLAIGTGEGPPHLEAGIRMAEQFEGFLATVGVHPHDASKAGPETFARLAGFTKHPKVVAYGEIGLDYHYDFSPRDVQRNVFIQQLEIAREAKLPVVIHTREAWEDTVRLLRENWQGGGIMHCFTGNPEQAGEALDLGFHLAFGGVITFPKSEETRAAARMTPDDFLLVETDAPYLAPAPHRGKRNEPAFVAETVRKLAEIRGVEPERMAEITTRNFERLCRLCGNGYTEDSHERR